MTARPVSPRVFWAVVCLCLIEWALILVYS